MKKIIMSVVAVMASVAVSHSQNLDPSVEVSRVYEGKLMEVHKPAVEMSVPDTVQHFGLEFDYSVFENPYKGSYEFSPYMLRMRPDASGRTQNTFYLLAGAGYTLYPTFDMLWSPVKKGPFSVDVYAAHGSYIGGYRALQIDKPWNGYDCLTRGGADFGYDWKKAVLDFGASYYGIAEKDYMKTRAYNAVDAYMSLKSKSLWSKRLGYALSAYYRFADDKADYAVDRRLCEHNFGVDAFIGPRFSDYSRLVFDLGVELDRYSGAYESVVSGFSLNPRYVYEKGRLSLDAGLKFSAVLSSDKDAFTKGQIVYPDVNLSLSVIPDAMRFFVKVGGGDRFNTYSSLLAANHHLDLRFAPDGYSSLMGLSVERVSATAGFEGRISGYFSYNLEGGYRNYANCLFDVIMPEPIYGYVPAIGYSSCQKCFATLVWNLETECFRFDGSAGYEYVWDVVWGNAVMPAAVTGSASAEYNWNRRIYVGVDGEFASSRTSAIGYRVPWYLDLGVYAEYSMNRKLSFWLRGGNLLNMEIQRNLLFAEKGINFTAGICLTL